MIVINAPDPIPLQVRPSVFLAGGIQKCEPWQDQVIKDFYMRIAEPECEPVLLDCCVYNPRRGDFGEMTEEKVREQIAWEYYAIQAADVFSMFFCASESDQPICMFELGKALVRHQNIALCVELGYLRAQDVHIQVELARKGVEITDNLADHVQRIENLLRIVADYG